MFPGNQPTREQLDAAVMDRPAVLRAWDAHSVWVNSRALAIAGITKETPDPPNGWIVRDPHTGEATGWLKEAAQELISKVVPPPTRAEQRQALRGAIAELHRFGITSLTEASGSPAGLALLDEARRAGELTVRVNYALRVMPGFTEQDALRFDDIWQKHPDTPVLKTGIVKIMLDGVGSAQTAFMLVPYETTRPTEQPSYGAPFFSREELDRVVQMLDRRGWQIMIHTLGDGAVRMALDALERAAKANPPPLRGRRHRLEHVVFLDPLDVPRFSKLGVIAAFQPTGRDFVPFSAAAATAAAPAPARMTRTGGHWRSVAAAGGRVTFGSDWFVAPLNPMIRVSSIVNSPPRPSGTDQRLTLMNAIDAYTSVPAYASFEESRVGTLTPGKLADVVVLATDVFSRPPTKAEDVAVAMTFFDGKTVYRASPVGAVASTLPPIRGLSLASRVRSVRH